MRTMVEVAGKWLRVSTGGQDEQDQEPDEDRWIADHDYVVGSTYRLHGASASKGKHQKLLDQVLADMRDGKIQVLVVWYSARIERRGAWDHMKLAYDVRAAGGRIEYVKEPMLNEVNAFSDTFLAMHADLNKKYSSDLSMNVRKAFNTIDANGAIRGRNIYGFQIVGEKKHKKFEEVEEETKVIKNAVRWYLEGQSLAMICRTLNDAGRLPRPVKNPKTHNVQRHQWTPKTLGQLLRSETICGRHHQGDKIVSVPVIIPLRTWKQLQEKMDTRAYRKGVRTRGDTAFLTSLLYCEHGHPLYKIGAFGGPAYYDRLCPKGQRISIPVDQLDREILDTLSEPREGTIGYKTVTEPGHDWQDELDQKAEQIQDALRQNPLADVSGLQAEYREIDSRPPTEPTTHTVEMTWAEWQAEWDGMTMAQKREFMLAYGMRFVVSKRDGKYVVTAQNQ